MKKVGYVAILTIGILLISNFIFGQQEIGQNTLKKFSSYYELKNFVKTNIERSRGYDFEFFGGPVFQTATVTSAKEASVSSGTQDYSTTNIQVADVDEADIVKNDGKYIYLVSGNEIAIIDAYPAEDAKVLSKIELDGKPEEIFINKDSLITFGRYSGTIDIPVETKTIGSRLITPSSPYPYYSSKTFINVYDISDRERPTLKKEMVLDGSYFDSRMIRNYAYIILNQPLSYDGEIAIPQLYSGNETKPVSEFPEIYYFDTLDYSYTFTTVLSINVQDGNEISKKVILMPNTQNMYVSSDSIYVTYTKRASYSMLRGVAPEEILETEKTIIHRIAIKDGNIGNEASGEVPGHVINQFSMDEHNGHFRIATTTGEVSRFEGQAPSQNNVYVLDENLNIVGKLENLAPGEKIYSARFIGEKAYLVTFKKVDPLFVIDLSDVTSPKVLGKLKIPGYSDYLHPVDENHIIGLGKETVEAEQGDFAWYQGVKLSLFDVSDVSNPKQISKYEIGDRGTDSYALKDHKAFLFSKSKNLLVIPILLAEIDKSDYAEVPPYAYGDFVWQGTYVFDLSVENGFVLKGRVTHLNDGELLKSGYYFSSPYSVKRSLYIGNVLYTISDKMIKMNDLNSLGEINKVEL